MVNNANSTIYDRLISLHNKIGLDYSPDPNTTLNEKLGIYPNVDIKNKRPILSYVGIGNGGNNVIYDVLKTSNHEVKDSSLFNHVPFLIIEKSKDLTIQERADYRLRKETIINGVEYVEYYLKKLSNITKPEVFIVEKTGELTTRLKPFNFNDASILNPTPKVKEDFLNANKTTYVAVTCNASFGLSELEVDNIKAAIELKFGPDSPKIISEICLFTGVEQNMANGPEALSVQAAFFQTVQYDLQSMLYAKGVSLRDIQIGGMEVLK